MDCDDLTNDLKVKQEPIEEHQENTSSFDVKLEDGIEFCAVQTIKQEHILEIKVNPDLVKFDYNEEPGCNDKTSITCSSGLLEYNEASSSHINKDDDDDDGSKIMPIECILHKTQMENTEHSSGLIGGAKKNECDKSFICETCRKVFPTQKLLSAHAPIHKEKVYKCHICNKHLSHSTGLKEHLKRHQGIKNYQCNICFKNFIYISDFKRHLLVHQDKRYECDICRCKLKQKSALRSHIKQSHLNSKEYQCEICKKHFGRTIILKKHMVTHGTSTEHQCHICEKYFHNAHDLKRHFVTHSKVKSFRCKICNLFYSQRSYLNVHMKIHEDIMYKCDTCGNTFSCKAYLLKHFKRHKSL